MVSGLFLQWNFNHKKFNKGKAVVVSVSPSVETEKQTKNSIIHPNESSTLMPPLADKTFAESKSSEINVISSIINSSINSSISEHGNGTDIIEKEIILNINANPFGLKVTKVAEIGALSVYDDMKIRVLPVDRSKLLGRWLVELGADANQTGLMYRAAPNFGTYIHKNYFRYMKSGEWALSAGRVNASILYQISAKHSLKLGLSWAENRTQQQFDFQDSMPATVSQGKSTDALGYFPIFGYLGLGPRVNFSSQSTYTMLSIPLGWTGTFPFAKGLSFTPEALIQANNLRVSSGAQTLDYQTLMQKNQTANQFRRWVYSARVAVGVEKRLNYSHSIGLRLNAQSMMSPMYIPNAALQTRGWSMGLSAHYSWRIQ